MLYSWLIGYIVSGPPVIVLRSLVKAIAADLPATTAKEFKDVLSLLVEEGILHRVRGGFSVLYRPV